MLAENPRLHQAQHGIDLVNRKLLIGVSVAAGLVQAAAGVAMYLACVYFAPWSMFVTLFLLIVCIVVGTRWYANHGLNGKITYLQALGVGIAISVSTGLIYAIYNLISISWFYPHFLDDVVRAPMDPDLFPGPAAFAALRA